MKKTFLFLLVFVVFQTATYGQYCWCAFLTNFDSDDQPDGSNIISWTTNTESAEAYDFIVERSLNGGSSFSAIGYVSANPGAASHNYSFKDPYPCRPGETNVHYRLKMVNINGAIRYSELIKTGASSCPSSCSSNPTACKCSLNNFTGPTTICNGDGIYEVLNASGPVTWSFSNPSVATVEYLSSTKIKLTKVGNGSNTITAAISGCSNLTKIVAFSGPPDAGVLEYINFLNGANGEGYFCTSHTGNEFEVLFSTVPENTAIEYRLLSWPNLNVVYTSPNSYPPGAPIPVGSSFSPGWYVLEIRLVNGCGATSWIGYEVEFMDCNNMGGEYFSIQASPNPASTELYVRTFNEKAEVKSLKSSEKVKYVLYGFNRAQAMKQWTFDNSEKQHRLNVSDVKPGQYLLVVTKGKYKQTKQIIIK